MNQPVRAVRAAIVAGIVAMAYVVSLFVVKTVPNWAIGMFGGPSRPIDRYGGLALTFRPAPGSEGQFDAYVAQRGQAARRDGALFVVEFPGLPEAAAKETLDLLTYGGLVMKEVVRTDHAKEIGEHEGVTIEVDQWRPEGDSGIHTDLYLKAATPAAMEAAVAGYQPPPGIALAFEWVEPPAYEHGGKPYLRSYTVKSEVAIDGSMIDSATSSYDPYTNRPIVLLDFTRAGGEKFCKLTERIVGEKLATIAGGRIRSAPIINSRICGGRASITMGGTDPEKQEREANALVATLRTGAIPPGTIESQAWKPAANVSREAWLARLLFGLVAALAAGALAFAAVRFTKPVRRLVARVDGASGGKLPWRRILVTAFGMLVFYVGATYLSLPGVDEFELQHVLHRDLGARESVFGLGVTPILSAYVLVELVALAWPRLRWRRHDPKGRIGLGRAVAAVAIALALVQAHFIAQYYASAGRFGYGSELVTMKGLKLEIMIVTTLAAGTMLLAIIAGVIREHGLGNGYGVLLSTAFVLEAWQGFHAVDATVVLGLVGAVGLAVLTRALLRWRMGGLRMPTSGVAPLSDSGGIVLLVVTLASLGFGEALWHTMERVQALRASTLWNVIILVLGVPLWSWLFARPSLVPGQRWSHWVRATVLTLGVFVVAWYLGPAALSVMILTATILDVADDLRAHRRKLVAAGIVHQAQYIGLLEHALDEAGIPAHFHASHMRTLVAFFGPWAPIVVMVPEEHAEVARRLVYATITKEHHAVVQAFARDARPTRVPRFVPAWARTT